MDNKPFSLTFLNHFSNIFVWCNLLRFSPPLLSYITVLFLLSPLVFVQFFFLSLLLSQPFLNHKLFIIYFSNVLILFFPVPTQLPASFTFSMAPALWHTNYFSIYIFSFSCKTLGVMVSVVPLLISITFLVTL